MKDAHGSHMMMVSKNLKAMQCLEAAASPVSLLLLFQSMLATLPLLPSSHAHITIYCLTALPQSVQRERCGRHSAMPTPQI